jgi:hypothetical protein
VASQTASAGYNCIFVACNKLKQQFVFSFAKSIFSVFIKAIIYAAKELLFQHFIRVVKIVCKLICQQTASNSFSRTHKTDKEDFHLFVFEFKENHNLLHLQS